MMPTFPRSPLSFRTAVFPSTGWKAGFPSGAFLDDERLKPAPGMRHPTSSLHPPSPAQRLSRSVSGHQLDSTTVEGYYSSAPGALAQPGFRGSSGPQPLRPARLQAPRSGPDRSPGQRGLLLPGFQRVGRPSRCSIPARSVRAGGMGGAGQDRRLGTLRAEILDRSRQEAVAPQRAGDRPRQQACRIAWAVLPKGAPSSCKKNRRSGVVQPA